MHGLVGRLRAPGTALIVEDVCVTPERIAECAVELQGLLGEHGFLTGVAGHASAGNLHFMLTPDFAKPEDLERYEAFMKKLVEMIVGRYDGSLKAEHGTGVNMAPFLELEWGPRATELMWEIKQLADPDGLLGPGVVLNREPGCHLQNLKTTPEVEESVTACVECGFCEPVCPSRDLTTTPRQRIVLRREMVRQPAGSPVLEALASEFVYDGLDTCAVDGSCALACPLGIDTGALVKELRGAAHGPRASRAAEAVSDRWRLVEVGARTALKAGAAAGDRLGPVRMRKGASRARALAGAEAVPAWVEPMPSPADAAMPATRRDGAAAVYMPACINRIFGATGAAGAAGISLPAALVAVSERAGMPVWIPDDVAGSCCGTPQSSKGFASAHARRANETAELLWRWSGEGELPIVCDATSCTHGLIEATGVLSDANRERHAKLEIVDSIEWAGRLLAAQGADGGLALKVTEPLGAVTVHPTCSSRKLGLDRALAEVAGALAAEVRVPPSAGCCGFAGDRGFLHPELTASALAPEAAEIAAAPASDAYLCANRTCEIGLRRETGHDYESVIHLLEQKTRPDAL
jgi:D-lactate dehydrogenase